MARRDRDDGVLSKPGRKLDQRRIHAALAYVERLDLQADLQGTVGIPSAVQCHLCWISSGHD